MALRPTIDPPFSRAMCWRCRKSARTCYCADLPKLETRTRFVILQHPKEARNPIGTGRLAHLALADSLLLQGVDFSEDARLNALIEEPAHSCAILYPGPGVVSLSGLSDEDRGRLIPADRRFVLFVIDGTWAGARPVLRRSRNLARLPRVSFEMAGVSAYQGVRKQPRSDCLSTIEAIGRVLRAIESPALEEKLLAPFLRMVAQQLAFGEGSTVRTEGRRVSSVGASSRASE